MNLTVSQQCFQPAPGYMCQCQLIGFMEVYTSILSWVHIASGLSVNYGGFT